MKSYYEGKTNVGAKLHMVQYFDGQRIRESSVVVVDGVISYTERIVQGILETGIPYKTAKRRLAAYEERCTRRIG